VVVEIGSLFAFVRYVALFPFVERSERSIVLMEVVAETFALLCSVEFVLFLNRLVN